MSKVYVIYDRIENQATWNDFKANMTAAIVSFKGEGFDFSEDDVTFVTTTEGVEMINPAEAQLIIAYEEVSKKKIGTGTLKSWLGINENLKVILVVDSAKFGSGKLHGLYELGYYNALLFSDFKWSKIRALLEKPRTRDEAYEYYGLIRYRAPETDVKEKAVEEFSESAKDDIKKDKTANEDLVTKRGAEQKGGRSDKSGQKKANKQAKEPDLADIPVSKVTFGGSSTTAKGVQKGNNESKDKSADNIHVSAEKAPIREQRKDNDKNNDKQNDAPRDKDRKNKAKDKAKDRAKDNAKAVKDDMPVVAAEAVVEDVLSEEAVNVPEMSGNTLGEEYDRGEDISFDSEAEYDPTDSSMYLLPVMQDEVLEDVDWLSKDDKSALAFIEDYEDKALTNVDLDGELSAEEEVLEDILYFFTKEQPVFMQNLSNGQLTRDGFKQILTEKINEFEVLTKEQKAFVYEEFCNFMWDYDILIPFIDDPKVSDIALVAYNNIQIKREGHRYFSRITFRSPDHYKAFINHIVKLNHVNLSDEKPNKTFMDTRNSDAARMRFVYSQEYINANNEPSLVIRKVSTKKYSLKELVNARMMTLETAAYLVDKVRRGASIFFTGTMASGKTTIFNTLLDFVRHDQRGLIMQENDELFSNSHPLFTFQTIRSSADGKELFDLTYLATFGLLEDIDLFGIGEVKGRESEQLVEAVFTNTTTWCSIHSISERHALPRAAALATSDKFTYKEQLKKLAEGVDLVVYLDKFVIEGICEVCGWDEEHEEPIYKDVPITIPEKATKKLRERKRVK